MIWFINHEEEEFETNMVFNVQFPIDRAFIRYLDIDNVNIKSADDFQELISNITTAIDSYSIITLKQQRMAFLKMSSKSYIRKAGIT